MVRRDDLHLRAELHDPADEACAGGCLDPDREGVLVRVDDGELVAEEVGDGVIEFVGAAQFDDFHSAGEALEDLRAVVGGVELLRVFGDFGAGPHGLVFEDVDPLDALDAQVQEVVVLRVVADEVVVVVQPDHRVGRDRHDADLVANGRTLFETAAFVSDLHPALLVDGLRQFVDAVVDGVVVRLVPLVDVHLLAEVLPLVDAEVLLEFRDEFPAVGLGDETRGLDSIGDEPQFHRFEFPVAEEEALLRGRRLDDVEVVLPQDFEVRVNGFPLCPDAAVIEFLADVRRRHRMIFVRLLPEDIHKV